MTPEQQNGRDRIQHLRDSLETLQIADEVAKQGYLITSSELADGLKGMELN